MFEILIITIAIIIILLAVSAFQKKKKTSKKVDQRVSSLRREFGNVKKESHDSDNEWLERRLDNDFDEEEFIISNRK